MAAPRNPPHYSADQARGARIILRTRTHRLIFIAGLVLAMLLGFFWYEGAW